MADIVIKKGDRSPSIDATLRKGGAVINLTGGTVNFVMRAKNGAPGGSPKVNAACTLVTPASGIVRYDWAAADVDTPGIYHAEFKVTLSGLITTCPNDKHLIVEVLGDLD